ncbi:MAG: Gfo/Idh/MocA family protein [Flexilinea sp.]
MSKEKTMFDELRWGILSTARITEAAIFALRSAPRSKLVAVASRDANKARAFAAGNDINTAYGSYEELLADQNINAVYIPLPNTLHAEWAIKAVRAGKHVLVEKPIVTKLEDLDALEIAARENNVVVFEAFMSLHAPQNRLVLELIRKGRIGNLRLINNWFSYYLSPEDHENIRLNPDLAGGSFWDIGVYLNSLVITMSGGLAPERVWAVQDIGETGVDVGLSAQLQFKGGTIAQIYSGLRCPFVECAQFIGSEGVIKINRAVMPGMNHRSELGSDTTIEIIGRDGNTEKIVVPASNPWQKEIEAMEACVLDGTDLVVPLSLSREFLKSALSLLESARTNQIVTL